MKAALLTVPSLLLLAAGFASAQAPAPLQSDYYPLKIGQRWTYQVVDLRKLPVKVDPKMTVDIQVEKEEIYSRKNKNNGKDEMFTGYLLKMTSGQKIMHDQVVVLEEGVHRVHTAKVPLTPPLLIFKLPLKDGDTWQANSTSGKDVIKGTFTAKHEKITVPAGEYNAMAIRFRSDPAAAAPFEFTNWFVRGIGMVKHHVKSKDHERLLELQSFSGGK